MDEKEDQVVRVARRDWRDLPRGFYALPVVDRGAVVGYRTFGRRNGFEYLDPVVAEGAEPSRLRIAIRQERDAALDTWGPSGDMRQVVDRILIDLADGDTYRPLFAQVTRRCWHCRRPLTSQASQLAGVGPTCLAETT